MALSRGTGKDTPEQRLVGGPVIPYPRISEKFRTAYHIEMSQLDHTAFLASVAPERRKELTETTDQHALVHLAGHAGLVAVLLLWVGLGGPYWGAVLLPLGVAMVFFFTLQHECTHRTPFRTAWLNEAVGTLIGLILIQPFAWFRAFHMAHHKYTNDPEHDPELAKQKPETWGAFAKHLSGLDYWPAKVRTLFSNALGRLDAPYIAPRQGRRIIWEARAMIALYGFAAVAFGDLLFWVWLLPLALGFPFLRLYLLAEHARCPSVADMFANTRTTLTTRAIRWLAWNMPYHAEHHAWPQVPYHRLPEVHEETAKHLKSVSPGYGAFTKSYTQSL